MSGITAAATARCQSPGSGGGSSSGQSSAGRSIGKNSGSDKTATVTAVGAAVHSPPDRVVSPVFLGGLRPHTYRVYMDGRLVEEHHGY
jgi:hypothetical protein